MRAFFECVGKVLATIIFIATVLALNLALLVAVVAIAKWTWEAV